MDDLPSKNHLTYENFSPESPISPRCGPILNDPRSRRPKKPTAAQLYKLGVVQDPDGMYKHDEDNWTTLGIRTLPKIVLDSEKQNQHDYLRTHVTSRRTCRQRIGSIVPRVFSNKREVRLKPAGNPQHNTPEMMCGQMKFEFRRIMQEFDERRRLHPVQHWVPQMLNEVQACTAAFPSPHPLRLAVYFHVLEKMLDNFCLGPSVRTEFISAIYNKGGRVDDFMCAGVECSLIELALYSESSAYYQEQYTTTETARISYANANEEKRRRETALVQCLCTLVKRVFFCIWRETVKRAWMVDFMKYKHSVDGWKSKAKVFLLWKSWVSRQKFDELRKSKLEHERAVNECVQTRLQQAVAETEERRQKEIGVCEEEIFNLRQKVVDLQAELHAFRNFNCEQQTTLIRENEAKLQLITQQNTALHQESLTSTALISDLEESVSQFSEAFFEHFDPTKYRPGISAASLVVSAKHFSTYDATEPLRETHTCVVADALLLVGLGDAEVSQTLLVWTNHILRSCEGSTGEKEKKTVHNYEKDLSDGVVFVQILSYLLTDVEGQSAPSTTRRGSSPFAEGADYEAEKLKEDVKDLLQENFLVERVEKLVAIIQTMFPLYLMEWLSPEKILGQSSDTNAMLLSLLFDYYVNSHRYLSESDRSILMTIKENHCFSDTLQDNLRGIEVCKSIEIRYEERQNQILVLSGVIRDCMQGKMKNNDFLTVAYPTVPQDVPHPSGSISGPSPVAKSLRNRAGDSIADRMSVPNTIADSDEACSTAPSSPSNPSQYVSFKFGGDQSMRPTWWDINDDKALNIGISQAELTEVKQIAKFQSQSLLSVYDYYSNCQTALEGVQPNEWVRMCSDSGVPLAKGYNGKSKIEAVFNSVVHRSEDPKTKRIKEDDKKKGASPEDFFLLLLGLVDIDDAADDKKKGRRHSKPPGERGLRGGTFSERFTTLLTDHILGKAQRIDLESFKRTYWAPPCQHVVQQASRLLSNVYEHFARRDEWNRGNNRTLSLDEWTKFCKELEFVDAATSRNDVMMFFNCSQDSEDATSSSEMSCKEWFEAIFLVGLSRESNPLLCPHIRFMSFVKDKLIPVLKRKFPAIKGVEKL